MGFQSTYKLIIQLQESGKCCGFGKPYSVLEEGPSATMGCVTDKSSNSLLASDQYQRCFGFAQNADNFQDIANTQKANGESLRGLYCKWAPGKTAPMGEQGCGVSTNSAVLSVTEQKYAAYDFPAGTCPALCYPYGCAQVVYEYVRNRLAAFSLIVLLLVLVNTFGFFSACCLALSHGFVDQKHGGGKGKSAAKQPLKADKSGRAGDAL
jgi:hypothetical protein